MSLLVAGSIGIDTVETPGGRADDVLGGSAIYFALAASLFTEVRVVGVVGEDFDMNLLAPLRERRIDLRGIEVRPGSKTFRWHGKYFGTMNERETVSVELNVLGEQGAPVPEEFIDTRLVFLANTHPQIQRTCAERMASAELVVCDTMNLWIANELEELRRTLGCVHGLVANDEEARLLTGRSDLVGAGREILELGPRFVVIKKGEHGSLLVMDDDLFLMPAYPTARVVDPTGCGDSFAGAMMGYLAAKGWHDRATLRSAIACGTVVASFVIESFSIEALAATTPADIKRRTAELAGMVRFD
ncbi:MAG: sugar kinase [Planctomycetes bacterium]|nr:sugar kinase [Planctomycetota bacterium]